MPVAFEYMRGWWKIATWHCFALAAKSAFSQLCWLIPAAVVVSLVLLFSTIMCQTPRS